MAGGHIGAHLVESGWEPCPAPSALLQTTALPILSLNTFFPAHLSSIRQLSFLRLPMFTFKTPCCCTPPACLMHFGAPLLRPVPLPAECPCTLLLWRVRTVPPCYLLPPCFSSHALHLPCMQAEEAPVTLRSNCTAVTTLCFSRRRGMVRKSLCGGCSLCLLLFTVADSIVSCRLPSLVSSA